MKDVIMYICGATTATMFMINKPIEAFVNLVIAITISFILGE